MSLNHPNIIYAWQLLKSYGYKDNEIRLMIAHLQGLNEFGKIPKDELEKFIQSRIDDDWNENPRDIKQILNTWIVKNDITAGDAKKIKSYLDSGILKYTKENLNVFRGIALFKDEFEKLISDLGISDEVSSGDKFFSRLYLEKHFIKTPGVNWVTARSKDWSSWSSYETVASGFSSTHDSVFANVVIVASTSDNPDTFFSLADAFSKVFDDKSQKMSLDPKKKIDISSKIAEEEFEYVATEKIVKIKGIIVYKNKYWKDPDLYKTDETNPF